MSSTAVQSPYCQRVASPIGALTITANRAAITALTLARPGNDRPSALTERAASQLDEYFSGQRRHFELPLEHAGSDFQRRCWALLATIPYGQTRSYGWQAQQLGQPNAARAVGSANGANWLPIFIPCHRVITAAGAAGGYNLGAANKVWLIAHEAANNC